MNMHQIFTVSVLPELLRIVKQSGVVNSLLSISLYGSANYESYERNPRPRSSVSAEQDYDVWIVFKRGHQKETREFATELFGTSFEFLPNQLTYILYDKIRLQTDLGKFLLAPMIATEESYGLLRNNHSTNTLIPWYRLQARGRPPKVPICSRDFVWSEFDMIQTYLSNVGLWRLMMPLIIHQGGSAFLGTFIECALSGDCFYGNHKKEDELKRELFLDATRHLSLGKTDIPSKMYQMMTLEKKAGPDFKKAKVQQFSQWLSR